jgi:pyridoxal biosynthesis lyase PdxS
MLLGLRTRPARVFDLDPYEAVRTGRVGAMMQTGGLVGDVTRAEAARVAEQNGWL